MDLTLKVVLWFLGVCLNLGSRFMPSVRSQITRSLVFELSAGSEVARHWTFDATLRRAISRPGAADASDVSLRFLSSRDALRCLLSTKTVDRIIEGRLGGTIEINGSAFVVLWFWGLTRKFVRIGRERQPRRPLPGAYLAHDPASNGVERIVIEPPVVRLDPRWTDAWRARSTLYMVRACTGEPVPEP
jgi:hypothetical protein